MLFSPYQLGAVQVKNRLVVSPMCNYSAIDGVVNDFHLVTVGRYALGGAGMVMVEATAVQDAGRITHGDTGLWNDAQIPGLSRIAQFIREHGAVAAIQLGHAGRKASMQRPWFGNGPLNEADFARGDQAWPVSAPSAVPVAEGWIVPQPFTLEAIAQLRRDYVSAALRALKAGYQVLELHCAHGYLMHSFVSPLSNFRTDAYGGSFENRTRLLIEVAQDIRASIPKSVPLLVRLSVTDDLDGGWTIDDSVVLARLLKAVGVDAIDCSSGGILGSATGSSPIVPRTPRSPGFQVPWAEKIRREAGLPTMAVGLILTPEQAEQVVSGGSADLVAIGREVLDNPNWPVHAAQILKQDQNYALWPRQFGWWLKVREGILGKLGLAKR